MSGKSPWPGSLSISDHSFESVQCVAGTELQALFEQPDLLRAALRGYVFEERVDKLRKTVILAYPDKDIRNNTALTASDVNDFYYENLSN